MAEICLCDDEVKGFGQPTCIPSFGRDRNLIFVDYLDNTGAVNSIKASETLDQAFFAAKINAGLGASILDASQRWHITQKMNAVVGERADNITQDIDTIAKNVRQGLRNFDAMFTGKVAPPAYLKSLESLECRQIGYFIVDVRGNIIGLKNELTGDLDPIRVEDDTFQFKYMKPTAAELQNINIKFMVEENERDSNLNHIPANTISVDVKNLKSVINADGTVLVGTPSTTGTTIRFEFIYGDAFNPEKFANAVPSDFKATNLTTNLAVVIVTAPEAPLGTYAFTWAIQGSGDEIKVEIAKDGFVGSAISTTP